MDPYYTSPFDYGMGGGAPMIPGQMPLDQQIIDDLRRRASRNDQQAIRLLAQIQAQQQAPMRPQPGNRAAGAGQQAIQAAMPAGAFDPIPTAPSPTPFQAYAQQQERPSPFAPQDLDAAAQGPRPPPPGAVQPIEDMAPRPVAPPPQAGGIPGIDEILRRIQNPSVPGGGPAPGLPEIARRMGQPSDPLRAAIPAPDEPMPPPNFAGMPTPPTPPTAPQAPISPSMPAATDPGIPPGSPPWAARRAMDMEGMPPPNPATQPPMQRGGSPVRAVLPQPPQEQGLSPGLLPNLAPPPVLAPPNAFTAPALQQGGPPVQAPADPFQEMLRREVEAMNQPQEPRRRQSSWGTDLMEGGAAMLTANRGGGRPTQAIGAGALAALRGGERRAEMDERGEDRDQALRDRRLAILSAAQARREQLEFQAQNAALNREERMLRAREANDLRLLIHQGAQGAAGATRELTRMFGEERVANQRQDNQRQLDASVAQYANNEEKRILEGRKAQHEALPIGDPRREQMAASLGSLTPDDQRQIERGILQNFGGRSTRGRTIARREADAEIARVQRDPDLTPQQKQQRIQGITTDFRRFTGVDYFE